MVKKDSKNFKAVVPTPPTGSVYIFQTIQTLWGITCACLFLHVFHIDDWITARFRLTQGVVLAVIALASQAMFIPSMAALVRAREKFGVGQPLHHVASDDMTSEDERLEFLCRLRAFENIIEWLPIFISHAVACVFLGHYGLALYATIVYTIGRILFGIMYGAGDPNARIPGLMVSDFCALLVMRGALILTVWTHFTSL